MSLADEAKNTSDKLIGQGKKLINEALHGEPLQYQDEQTAGIPDPGNVQDRVK